MDNAVAKGNLALMITIEFWMKWWISDGSSFVCLTVFDDCNLQPVFFRNILSAPAPAGNESPTLVVFWATSPIVSFHIESLQLNTSVFLPQRATAS